MAIEFPAPHWERGLRCHGYWIGDFSRIGFIGLPPRFVTAKVDGYSWSMDFPLIGSATGKAKTLRSAKRALERAFTAKRAEMRQRTYHLYEEES